MKKKLISLALALIMVLSLFSVTAFADNPPHDLTVTKDGGAAVEGTKDSHEGADYYWDDSNWEEYGFATLCILSNGLTVSGTTTTNVIRTEEDLEEDVTNLTISNLSIQAPDVDEDSGICFTAEDGSCTLNVKGSNTLTTLASGIGCDTSLTITGDGDLTLGGDTGAYVGGDLTLDCSGTVTVTGTTAGIICFKNLIVTANTGKVIVYGEGIEGYGGAIITYNESPELNIDPSLVMTGSTTYLAPEEEITGETESVHDGEYEYNIVKTGDEVALSVLIARGSSEPEPECKLPGFIGCIVNSMLRIVRLIIGRIAFGELKPFIIGGAIVKIIGDIVTK